MTPADRKVKDDEQLDRGDLQGEIDESVPQHEDEGKERDGRGDLGLPLRSGFADALPEPHDRPSEEDNPGGKPGVAPLDQPLEPVLMSMIPEAGDAITELVGIEWEYQPEGPRPGPEEAGVRQDREADTVGEETSLEAASGSGELIPFRETADEGGQEDDRKNPEEETGEDDCDGTGEIGREEHAPVSPGHEDDTDDPDDLPGL